MILLLILFVFLFIVHFIDIVSAEFIDFLIAKLNGAKLPLTKSYIISIKSLAK